MIKYLSEINKNELAGKKVLVRVDFNVPVKGKEIEENYRVKAHKETIDYLIDKGAKILLVSHITIIDSFNPIVESLSLCLDQIITMVPLAELGSVDTLFQTSPLLLLDNIRQDKREEKNDMEFALSLSKGFDFYINDAFSASHRNHASVSAVAKTLPSYGGLLMEKEIESLSKVLNEPAEGKIIILGGAKISTKLPVIKNFLDKTEKILIGGALANNFFRAQGFETGISVVDNTISANIDNPKIILPEDFVTSGDLSGKDFLSYHKEISNIPKSEAIVDIGTKTIDNYNQIISQSSMVVWNGPMGIGEIKQFATGTNAIAAAIARTSNSIIGGGDTIAAVDKMGLLDKYSFVSTGGGAMLEFLAGEKLPGLEALGYYDN